MSDYRGSHDSQSVTVLGKLPYINWKGSFCAKKTIIINWKGLHCPRPLQARCQSQQDSHFLWNWPNWVVHHCYFNGIRCIIGKYVLLYEVHGKPVERE
jgi:hypothetical protein